MRINIDVTTVGTGQGIVYPVDMTLCNNVRYAHDMSFVLVDGPDELLAVPGVRQATPADEAALLSPDERLAKRRAAAKLECARRIVTVADLIAQANMNADSAAGIFNAEQAATYKEGVLWIKACRNTWPDLANSTDDIYADENWPTPSSAVIALAAEY